MRLLFLTPIIFLIEILLYNTATCLLRQPSDMAVIVGIFCISLFILFNYYLINFIIKQLKTKKK